MNEQIRKLATEAGLQPFEDCGPGYVYRMEKFSELIVQECLTIMESTSYLDVAVSEVKERFGIDAK